MVNVKSRNRENSKYLETTVDVKRVSKVVTGGRRFQLGALVVIGDGAGTIGYGRGKGKEVSEAIRKGTMAAEKNLIKINMKGTTIPHKVEGKFASGRIILKPAPEGTGIRAGATVRAIVEKAGIRDIYTKSIGLVNKVNLTAATFKALASLFDKEELLKERKGRK